MRRLVVKVGSNVVASREGKPDVERMAQLVEELAVLHGQGLEVAVVSSGAVAFGRDELGGALEVLKGADEVSSRQLYAAVGQAKLINKYYELFREHGIYCGQVLTTKENFASEVHYKNQKHCMEVMLGNGVIPVVNENDTVAVTELMFTDNDELSGLMAKMLGADALILLSSIDGIYDGDPENPESKLIKEVFWEKEDMSGVISTNRKSSFGRGGMESKYRIACEAARAGIEVIIANGRREGILEKLTGGEEVICTRFRR
jgi:glutamate 5-kinase